MRHAISGLAALAAAVLGASIYVGIVSWSIVLWLGLIGLIGRWAAVKSLRSNPVLSALLINVWLAVGVALMAIATAGVLWSGFQLTAVIPASDPAVVKEVGGVIMGALTTYLGLVFTKDMAEGQGSLWPSTQFRKGLQTAFGQGQDAPAGDTREFDAVHLERVRANGPSGWGFSARIHRARILKAHIGRSTRA